MLPEMKKKHTVRDFSFWNNTFLMETDFHLLYSATFANLLSISNAPEQIINLCET